MKNQDKEIERLTKLVEQKQALIDKSKRYNYNTRMVLTMDNKEYNLHTIQDIGQLVFFLSRLERMDLDYKETKNRYLSSSILIGDFNWNGFSFTDWKEDILARIEKINIIKEANQLAELKSALDSLTSEETRKLKKLKEIKNILGES